MQSLLTKQLTFALLGFLIFENMELGDLPNVFKQLLQLCLIGPVSNLPGISRGALS
jgi:hypothetical protein